MPVSVFLHLDTANNAIARYQTVKDVFLLSFFFYFQLLLNSFIMPQITVLNQDRRVIDAYVVSDDLYQKLNSVAIAHLLSSLL
ncbi:MAG: hypothetical protein HC939_23810 [Pleurocapsa sp. SU_5_0]|nr:hypothetical protein [Pleurocapsa sp. SU_5_0]